MVSPEKALRFKLVGGLVCLDFLNTLDGTRRRGGPSLELLAGYDDLLYFDEQSGLLTRREAAALRKAAAAHPRQAQGVVKRAITLREAIFGVLDAAIADRRPPAGDVELLNKEIAAAMAHARLCASGSCWEWGWEKDDTALERVLWPITHDAAELLTSPDLELVRECGSEQCSWLFLDATKNHRRRWCQMEVCGNRAKARRHREKAKKW